MKSIFLDYATVSFKGDLDPASLHRALPGLELRDHTPQSNVARAIDVVDFDYPAWHTPNDKLDQVSARSLQIVGDVAMALVRREGK